MIKNEVASIRKAANVSQVDLARAIGVSRQTIHAIETRKYIPSVELALKIARFFGHSVEDIFFLEE